MKKIRSMLIIFFTVFITIFIFFSCGQKQEPAEEAPAIDESMEQATPDSAFMDTTAIDEASQGPEEPDHHP